MPVRPTGLLPTLALVALAVTGCQRRPADPGVIQASTQGAIALQEGRLEDARAEFRKVVDGASWAVAGYASMAQVELMAGRPDQAEPWIRRGLRRDRSDITLHLLMAKADEMRGRMTRARESLEALASRSPTPDPRVLYGLVELADAEGQSDPGTRAGLLSRTLALEPGNLVLLLRYAEALAAIGQPDSALGHLEELVRLLPRLPTDAESALTLATESLRDLDAAAAVAPLGALRQALELTPEWQNDLRQIQGARGELAGRPVLSFSPLLEMQTPDAGAVDRVLAFRDVTDEAGLGAGPGAATIRLAAAGDYDGDGAEDLLVSGAGSTRLLHNTGVGFEEVTAAAGLEPARGVTAAGFGDWDNDGHLDLFLVEGDRGALRLYRNSGAGRFEQGRHRGLEPMPGATGVVFADLDHDGDLDLLLTGEAGARFYRNNLDGSFDDRTRESGLGVAEASGRPSYADLDHDGRLDLVVSGARDGGALFMNQGSGQQRFAERWAQSGLPGGAPGPVAIGDYDNDGELDLFVSGTGTLYRNEGGGRFVPDLRPATELRTLSGGAATDALFFDYDNDGWLDLAVAGTGGTGLYRNLGAGRFEDRSDLFPRTPGARLTVLDYDQDADQDLLVTGPGGIRLFRNDGGNANGYLRVRLAALRTGSGKNNGFGIGARLEVRAGALYQTRVVTGTTTLFGLGALRQADALRIVWPNGVPQVMAASTSDPMVREAELLKGSCGFLYTWDGTGYRFHTDVMWRSALGMPLGIMGGKAAWAPPAASEEYVLVPGDRLAPDRNRYRVQLTEELWETAYVDQLRLLVVDHPDGVEVLVDEKFVPPGPTTLRLYQVRGARPVAAATDARGRDLLGLLRDRDHRYVAGMDPGRYQGVISPHDLFLDLGDLAGADSVHLLLTGWIYPTDASINLAISQSSVPGPDTPSLAVADGAGGWVTVLPDLGFPAGKSKTVIADLSGKFPGPDHRVRIRSGMRVYWDQARVVTGGTARGDSRITTLEPVVADLHYRGFSRMFRIGGRYGPHWFDYDQVKAESPWLPIRGSYTRFGDVLPLLDAADDRYVIMAPGDEMTVEFPADGLPSLPAGWRRDFLFYSNGWIKDADLNTADGGTVEPLPFHAMSRYPYGPEERYPGDPETRRYLREYNTRPVP